MNGKQLINDIEKHCKNVSSLQWQKKRATTAIYLLPFDFDDGWTCSFVNSYAPMTVGFNKLVIECKKPKNHICIEFYSDSIISYINEIQMSALAKPDINTMLLNLESHIDTFCNYNEEDMVYVGGKEQLKELYGAIGDIKSLYNDGIMPMISVNYDGADGTFGETKIDICSCAESAAERNARMTKELIESLKESVNEKIENSDETSTVSMSKTDMLNMLNEILDLWERKT